MMGTLEKIAENFGLPMVDQFTAKNTEGWVANCDARSIEMRHKLECGKLEMLVYLSVRFFLESPVERWSGIMERALRRFPEHEEECSA